MQCGFHAYMESWGLAVDNPYYQLTQADGTFLAYGRASRGLYVGGLASRRGYDGGKENDGSGRSKWLKADFVFESPKGRRSAHEIEENPHYGSDSLGKIHWISDRLWNCRSRKA